MVIRIINLKCISLGMVKLSFEDTSRFTIMPARIYKHDVNRAVKNRLFYLENSKVVKLHPNYSFKDLELDEVDIRKYKDDTVILAKVIRTNGVSRGYASSLTKSIYNMESFFFRRLGNGTVVINKNVGNKLVDVPKHLKGIMLQYGIDDLFGMFQFYISVTQPVLAFYLIKRRSFKRKRKINKLSYTLKLASKFRRRNKLMHQIKSVFFRGPNRRSVGHLRYSTLSFFKEEFFKTNKSTFMQKKQRIYEATGGEVMNNIIHNERVRN